MEFAGLKLEDINPIKSQLADELYQTIPAGLGSTGHIHLKQKDMNAMLKGGALWTVQQGFGLENDLERIEEHGCMYGADPDQVSEKAKKRQQNEMGTLGSGNHYLELQYVKKVFDEQIS